MEDTGNATFNNFINDARYTQNVSWDNCYTYVQAFTGYCFGNTNFSAGTAFNSTSEVRAGDVIWINNSHYFAVLKRSGNSLYVAEGNYLGHVEIRWGYTISGNLINSESWTGWHWSSPAAPSTPTVEHGSEMSSGYSKTIPDGDYMIATAGNADKTQFYYLDIFGIDLPAASGTNVDLAGPTNGDLPVCEIWTVKYSNGFYTIKQKGTNMSLDVWKKDTSNGANICVSAYNGGSNQKWAISHNGNNGYRIQSKCSGYSVDVTGLQIQLGTNIQQCKNNTSDAQSWLFIPYKPSQTLAEGRYILLSAMSSSVELDVKGDTANVADNTNVQIWKDTAKSRYNSFDIKKLSNGYYSVLHAASGKSLDVTYAISTSSNVAIHSANNSVAQQWAITKDGYNGGYILRAKCSGYTLDVQGATTANGTNIWQHPINYGKNQTWVFVPAEYKVSFNANGGTSAPGSQTKYYKENLTLSTSKPSRSNYQFLRWNTKADGSGVNYNPGDVYSEDKDLILYAQWQAIPNTNNTSTGSTTSNNNASNNNNADNKNNTSTGSTSNTGNKTNNTNVGGNNNTNTGGNNNTNTGKQEQSMTVKAAKQKTISLKKLKKKKQKVRPITVQSAVGTVSYKIVGGSKKSKKALKINANTGKITVKKKTKKGTYKVKVKVNAAGNSVYQPASKTVQVTIKVK